MSLKTIIASCLAGFLGAACSITPTARQEQIDNAFKKIPDYTATDPKTGCRYIIDRENPDKPQICINGDFPKRDLK